MNKLVDKVRNNTLNGIFKNSILIKEDYKESVRQYSNGEKDIIDLPKSNVIKLIFENDISVTIRPSGTEPKIKLYYSVKGNDKVSSENLLGEFIAEFEEYLKI